MRPHTQHSPASGEHRPGERTGTATTVVETLQPTQPPGRLTRKARHYLPQILHLRAQGYTLETIQQALAAVGVTVSISTVRREALRPLPLMHGPGPAPSVARAATAHSFTVLAPASAIPGCATPTITGSAESAKDIAAAYAQSKSANPLTRAKETP
ncbi:MAG: hypothetical protein ABI671_00110 [Burkholderiales bacterium]